MVYAKIVYRLQELKEKEAKYVVQMSVMIGKSWLNMERVKIVLNIQGLLRMEGDVSQAFAEILKN